MPIHLAPISRRGFLSRSLLAGAGLLLSPKLRAETKFTDSNLWALLSDTHIAADRAFSNRDVNMTDHLVAVSRQLLALPKRPAGVFINGDCAYNTGQAGDYKVFTELLNPLREGQLPIHLTLGNHDAREAFFEVLSKEKTARPAVPDHYVGLLQTPLANWYLLDSLEKTASTPGLLGKEQLAWLAESLDANPAKPALILAHHNPGLNGNLGLKDTPAFLDVIRPRNQVKAFIFGHTHTWSIERDSSGIHLVNLPAVSYVFQEKQPSGWVSAQLDQDGMRLELRSLNTYHVEHGKVTELEWRKG